jgi:hypothetical protein
MAWAYLVILRDLLCIIVPVDVSGGSGVKGLRWV